MQQETPLAEAADTIGRLIFGVVVFFAFCLSLSKFLDGVPALFPPK